MAKICFNRGVMFISIHLPFRTQHKHTFLVSIIQDLHKKSIYLLQEYQKAFEKRLQEQMQLNTIMLEKLEFLKSLQDLPAVESVFEVDLPMRHMLTFGSVSGDSETHAMHFTRLEGYLNEKIPILASDRVGVYADESILLEREEMSLAIPMILVTPEDTGSEYLKEIPAGRYVCMYYHNGTLEKYDKSFEIIKAYIREKGYQICGSIIQLYKVDVTLTDDRSETIMEIQIPVCFT